MNIKGTIRFTSLLLAVLFGSCKNKAVDYSLFEIKEEHVQAESTNAVISGAYSFRGEVNGMKFNLGTNENLSDALIYDMLLEGDEFSIALDSLIPNTTYYYCYGVDFGLKNEYITEIKSFRTLQGEPLVKTIEIISQGEFSRKVKCEVVSDGGGTITERGIFWNTNGNPGVNDHKVKHAENGVGEYVCIMDGLEPNTTYYVRAYAKNDTGIGLAQEVLQFETHDNPSDSLMIVIDCNPPSGGTATGGGTFSFGQRCTVTATANEGYAFTQWTENGNQVSTEASYTFTVDRNRTLVANFTLNTYSITAIADPVAGGTVSGANTYNYGTSCTLTATAYTGYTFVNWTKNGTQVSTDASYIFIVTTAEEYVAHFHPKTYTISVSADPSNGGTVTGNGNYTHGQSCTITATANDGFVFSHWEEEDLTVSSNASYTFVVNGNRNLEAIFDQTYPVGAINGRFTINSDGGQVYFSQGNLQYIGSAGNGDENNTGAYWKFADNQWDYFGESTGQNSSDKTVDRDLFGWGTSGYNHGAQCYQPWSTSSTPSYYNAYGDSSYDLNSKTGEADWGYNPISNGGNMTNKWHTLTSDEWGYVINKRQTPSGIRYAKAIVNNINGVILLPDDWMNTYYELNDTDTFNADFGTNQINADQWRDLEQKGVVFLPAAGIRWERGDYGGYGNGNYWSASVATTNNVRHVGFNASYFDPQTNSIRCRGLSVRLVLYTK